MKEINKQTIFLFRPVIFDNKIVRKISFDLLHINEGWDEIKNDYAYRSRSSYSADDIVDFFEQFLFIQVEWEIDINKFEQKIRVHLSIVMFLIRQMKLVTLYVWLLIFRSNLKKKQSW